MATVDDVPRLFLQAVLSRRVLSSELARLLWEKSIEAVQECGVDLPDMQTTDNSWNELLQSVNESLNELDLEFRNFRDELNGRELFGIVNRKGDSVAQVATNYTAAEITYFKALIEQIMLAPRKAYSISTTAALREVTGVKGMTKLQAEQVLDNLVANRWLVRSKRGRYSLSSRTILELESYIKTEFPEEVTVCTVCKELLTKGFACHEVGCQGKVHGHCLRTTRGKCPSCQTDWPRSIEDVANLIPIGEAAVRDGEEFRRVNRRIETPGEEDEDQDMDAENSQEPIQVPKKKDKVKQQKGKGKKRRQEESEEEASMSEHGSED